MLTTPRGCTTFVYRRHKIQRSRGPREVHWAGSSRRAIRSKGAQQNYGQPEEIELASAEEIGPLSQGQAKGSEPAPVPGTPPGSHRVGRFATPSV